ncbi:MAG: hypothetical protein HC836_28115 [Richelia sp. RM2_1_2]|nr:hypothetical protein [Richelia sp. RM2_1_2]
MKTTIKVVFSSHLGKPANDQFTQHVLDTVGAPCHVFCYENYGDKSLSKVYNEALEGLDKTESIFVFCHNDITFKTKDWGKILLNTFNHNNYHIIGVAGTNYMPASGRWWDLPHTMIGIVDHTNGLREWTSNYSPKEYFGVKPSVIIDGLFMAFDPEEIEHGFDESFNGFHFYDLGFCFPNYLAGCNIGVVTNIRILHQSMGMTNAEWEKNRILFAEKYKDELPCQI